ncbi:hypothetical protein PM082_016086 [Marasmius tenuissimus]|nr:hypothetical protein PM082_016086 [Marasmius tenuissimus]
MSFSPSSTPPTRLRQYCQHIPSHSSPEYPHCPQSSFPSPLPTWPSPSSATSTTSPATPSPQRLERQTARASNESYHFQPARSVTRPLCYSLDPTDLPGNTPSNWQGPSSITQAQDYSNIHLHRTLQDRLYASNDLATVDVVNSWPSNTDGAHFRGAALPGNGYNQFMMEAATTSYNVISRNSRGHSYPEYASEASNNVLGLGLSLMTSAQSRVPVYTYNHPVVPPGIQVAGHSPSCHPTSTHGRIVLPPDTGRGVGGDFPPRTTMPMDTVASPSVIEASFKRRKFPAKHKCTLCGQTFTAGHGLTNHEKVHKGIKDFVCEFCSKEFTTKHTMKRHSGTCRSK